MSEQSQDRPVVTLPIEPPPLTAIVRDTPRGGIVDQHAEVASAAAEVPALSGEAAEREAYRQRLIAATRALDGRVVNSAVEGTLVGLAVAAVGVTLGLEAALVAGVAVGGWKLVSFLRGRP